MELVKEYKKLDTSCVSDAMDKLGIPCGCLGIKPVVPGHSICGRAFTVHYVPCGTVKGTVGDFLDDIEPGQVAVLDNSGRNYCTVWGDIMSVIASKKGIEGTVIDGVCRDIPMVKQIGYPIYSKGCYMSTGKDRVEVDGINVPVSISGIKVNPGDIVMGDDTGVVVIPQEQAEEVLAVAKIIEETEQLILAEVINGSSLKGARKKLRYHSLQRKESAN